MTGKKISKKKTTRTAANRGAEDTDADLEQDAEESELNPENPLGMYEDPRFSGPPQSAFESFQRFAHRHKRAIYATFFLAIILSFVVIMRGSGGANARDAVEQYFARFAGQSDDWQYNIDRFFIGKIHLNNLYPVLAKITYGDGGAKTLLNDRDLYDSFVREQYETDLLAFAALQENVLNESEARLFMENSLRQAAADYYLYKKVGTEATDFRVNISDAEAREYYNRNREFYKNSGLDEAAAMGVIKNTLAGLRRDQMRQQLAVARAQLVSRLKDRFGPRMNEE